MGIRLLSQFPHPPRACPVLLGVCVHDQSCLTVCDLMEFSHQTPLSMEFSTRIMEWVAISFSTSPANTPISPPSSFVLPSFAWVYIFFSSGQVLLSALSWCSACTSGSESVFLMYPRREMYSMSTDTSTIFESLSCPTSSPSDISIVTSLMNVRFYLILISFFSLLSLSILIIVNSHLFCESSIYIFCLLFCHVGFFPLMVRMNALFDANV